MSEHQREVDNNYEAFKKLLPGIIQYHRDKYALMKDGKIISYYSTAEDARITGERFLEGGPYSVQKVTDSAIDLGFFSHAVHLGHVQP